MSMTEAPGPPTVAGCMLSPLDSEACETYVSWLRGEPEAIAPSRIGDLRWALAHCDDGVTWGRRDGEQGIWRLGHEAAPDVSPPIRRHTLQELRIFGAYSEVLIWRTNGGFWGRTLCDTDSGANGGDSSDPLRPANESRILRGDRVIAPCQQSFTHIGDVKGAEQVLPLPVTDEQLRRGQVRLRVHHYFEQNSENGAVRIAASRLVALLPGDIHGT